MKKRLLAIIAIFITLPLIYSQELGEELKNLQSAELKIRLEEINQKIDVEPQNTELYLERGKIYYFLKIYNEAEKDFTYLINLSPNNYYYYYIRAELYSTINKYHEALDDLSKAGKYKPELGRLYYRSGEIYYSMNMKEEAIIAFTAALQRDRSDYISYGRRGMTFYELGKYREAIFDYTQAIYLSNDNRNYFFGRGQSFLMLKNYKEAISDFTNALALTPPDSSGVLFSIIYAYRGTAYIGDNGNFQEALNDFNRGIECYPESLRLHSLRSMLYEELAKRATKRSDRTKYQKMAVKDYTILEKLKQSGNNNGIDVIDKTLR